MKRSIGLIIGMVLCFTLFSGHTLHKYYVSVTEMEYNTESEDFEVSIKFIGHDLEHALKQAGVPELYLGTDKEHKEANDFLFKYISKHFSVVNDSIRVQFSFVGKEVGNDDFIFCYLKSKAVNEVSALTISNSLLVELFDKQTNILYYKKGSEKHNHRFTKLNTSIKIQ
jgi:hypothetical protein